MTFELLGGRRLLLAGARLGWFWIAVGALALVLLVVLYREERRLISRRAGLLLLGLRLAAAIALVLALFEPIAARTVRETLRGRVIVAVDTSESMETTDAGQSVSRRERARRLIDGDASPVGRLARDHAVEALAFARGTASTSLPILAEALKHPPKPGDPDAQTTDWGPVLAFGQQGDEDQAPLLGIVILTDGRQNGPTDASATVNRLAARGVPVFPIMIGSTVPPRDAAVAAVKAPESVYRGDVATVTATLKLDGYPGREVPVTLDRAGGSPLHQTVVAPAATGIRPVVTFQVPLNEVGNVPLSIAVGPVSSDSRPENDRRSFSIQVSDDKARVLLVDGQARWEFRYLRNALLRDPRIALETVVFRQPETTGSSKPSYEATLPPQPESAGNNPDPLGRFDVVVLGDVDPADLSSKDWSRLDNYVAERGGTLVASAGPRHWASLAAHETARKLWPVVDADLVPAARLGAEAAAPALAPGAAIEPAVGRDLVAWPMLQLGGDAAQNQAIWNGLPRQPWLLAGRAKPGATVLATVHGDDHAVVIAAQAYGLGKILWIGTDATWRFRFRVGDSYHHRFWGQVVRWASLGKLAAGNAMVRFGPDRPRVAEGESPRLQARFSDGALGVGPELLVAARIYKVDRQSGAATGDAVAIVTLRPVPGQPRTFFGDTPALPVGSYRMRLDVPERAELLAVQGDAARNDTLPEAAFEVTARETSEQVELAAARDPLEHLANATGGRVLGDSEADQLAPLLRARTKVIARAEETRLWDQPVAPGAFFLAADR